MRAFARPDLRPYLPDLRLIRAVGQGVCVLCAGVWAGVRRGLRAALGEPLKDATAVDKAERVGQGALVLVVVGVVGAGATVAAWHRVGAYGPWLAGGGLLILLAAALAVAPAPAVEKVEEPPLDGATDEPGGPREEVVRVALLRFLEVHTRGRNGIHLAELHQHLARTGAYAALRRAEVGPLLEANGVPTVRSLTVGGVSGRTGVRRTDVLALLSPDPQAPLPAQSRSVSSFSDLGISRLTLADSRPSESGSERT